VLCCYSFSINGEFELLWSFSDYFVFDRVFIVLVSLFLLQKCDINKLLQHWINGKPKSVELSSTGTSLSFETQLLDKEVNRNTDNRLRVFSGTSNPGSCKGGYFYCYHVIIIC